MRRRTVAGERDGSCLWMLVRSEFLCYSAHEIRLALEMVCCGDADAMRALRMEIERNRRFLQSVCEEEVRGEWSEGVMAVK